MDVDHSNRMIRDYPGVDFLYGDSASPEMVARVSAMLPPERGALFVILDSDHSKAHVLRELRAWVPFMRAGDYLVVEDGCVNGHPVRPEFGPGPYEAVTEFLAAQPGLLAHDAQREEKFGCTFAPLGYFIRN
jgi:cephalosporin hydroxylase